MASGRGTVGNLLIQMRVELGQLKTDVREVQRTFESGFANIKTSAASFGRDLAGSLGIGLSVGAVVGFAKSVIDLGSRLKDLKEQTGFSVQTLSGLKSVLEENGSSLEAFATGIFRLQKELGTIKNESDPTAQAIKQLGLNLDELRNADTDKFLTLVSEALAKIENPITRNALAFQFMGRQARELVPALLEMAGKVEDFRSKGLTEADVKVLDDFADSWTRASNAVKLFVATDIAGVIREFSKDLEFLNGLMVDFGSFDFTQSLTSFTKGLQNTQKEILQFYESMLKIIRAAPLFFEWLSFGKLNFNSKMWTDMIKSLEDLKNEIGQPSSHEEVPGARPRFIPPVDEAALKKARDELARIAESIDQENNKLEEQIIELQHGKDAANDWALSQKEMAEAAKGMTAEIQHQQDRRRAYTQDLRDAILQHQIYVGLIREGAKLAGPEESTVALRTPEELKEVTVAEVKAEEETKKLREEWAKLTEQSRLGMISDDTLRRITEIGLQFNHLAEQIQKVGEALKMPQEEIDNLIAGVGNDFRRQIEQIKPPKTEAQKIGEELGQSLSQGLKNTLLGIETGQQTIGEGMKNLLRNMVLEIQGMVLDKTFVQPLAQAFSNWISEALTQAMKTSGGGGGSGAASWISKGIGLLGGLFGGMFGGSSGSILIGGGGYGSVSGPVGAMGGLIKGNSILSFASGGMVPIFAHAGEFVMNRRAVDSVGAGMMSQINKSGQLPATKVTLDFQGAQIIPRAPWTTAEDVVKVGVKHINDDGMWVNAMANRMSRK